MRLKLPLPIYRLLKATRIWQDNYLIWQELKSFQRIAILAVVFSLLAAISEGLTVGAISLLFSSLTNTDKTVFQTGIDWFDHWFLGTNASATGRLYRSAALILVLVWLRSGFFYLQSYFTKYSQILLADRLRKRVFDQLLRLRLNFFAKKRSGELINSLRSETNKIAVACSIISLLISQGATFLVYILSMFLLSWQLAFVSTLIFTLLTAGLTNVRRTIREVSFEIVKVDQHLTSISMEFINSIRTVHAFATQDFERGRFYKASDEVVEANKKGRAASSLVQPVSQGAATTIILIILIAASTILIANGSLQLASLLTFLFVLLRLAPIVSQLNAAWSQLASFQGPLNNIRELLQTYDKPFLTNGKIPFPGLQRAIEFVAVDFGYDSQNLVLHNISLTIPRGQITALIGASGAGKSTLVDLIPRFYDPTQGRILLDGVDLRKFEVNSLRSKLAIVSQDTFIFNTSVWNNIAYGTEKVNESAIWEAARLAHALEFILELPEGFDTQLGNRGVRLSGGQRQRLAIARALLRNPEILILDEATSALDSVSERLIQESLEKLSVGRTVIAIAHRLSTIVRADRVIVLERGQIVEQGRYQELLKQRGKLWKYHQMQHQLIDKD